MNRKCYRLQSEDVFLGLPIDKLFETKKQANEYFYTYCLGTGIISKVRAEDTRKFYSSMDILPTTKIKNLASNE